MEPQIDARFCRQSLYFGSNGLVTFGVKKTNKHCQKRWCGDTRSIHVIRRIPVLFGVKEKMMMKHGGGSVVVW